MFLKTAQLLWTGYPGALHSVFVHAEFVNGSELFFEGFCVKYLTLLVDQLGNTCWEWGTHCTGKGFWELGVCEPQNNMGNCGVIRVPARYLK